MQGLVDVADKVGDELQGGNFVFARRSVKTQHGDKTLKGFDDVAVAVAACAVVSLTVWNVDVVPRGGHAPLSIGTDLIGP